MSDNHWPTLIFEDSDGDLVRCDCGEQGFDFKQGREWFAEHLRAATRPAEPVVEVRYEATPARGFATRHAEPVPHDPVENADREGWPRS